MIETINGNALHLPLPDKSAQCCITSPPYWGLRNYGVTGQLGLESTPDEYVANIVAVMREVWRVLRDDGVLWLNLGDSYASNPTGSRKDTDLSARNTISEGGGRPSKIVGDLKPKDLVGIPWLVAFALRSDGWYLRSEIIWHKPNPMPESVTDRPTKAHEQVFLLAKQEHYYYDAEAIKEGVTGNTHSRGTKLSPPKEAASTADGNGHKDWTKYTPNPVDCRNRRTVWTIATESYSGSHFATFPTKLVEPMILAGTSPQACESCGAPWEREIERGEFHGRTENDGDGYILPKAGVDPYSKNVAPTKNYSPNHRYDYRTVGWCPTCDCPPERNTGSGKCIVIDPFAGTSTVGKVCAKHGRSFVGIELNQAYIELAQVRTSGIQVAMPMYIAV